jgi:hypothetical protein
MLAPVDAVRLRALMRAVARAARGPLQVYLVGGATAVAEGWRDATIDIDVAFGPDHDAVLRAIPAIKEALDINVELASPVDFIPVKAGWQACTRRHWPRSNGDTKSIARMSGSFSPAGWWTEPSSLNTSRRLHPICIDFRLSIRRHSAWRWRLQSRTAIADQDE